MLPVQTLSLIMLAAFGLLIWTLEAMLPFFLRSRNRSKHAALNVSLAGLNLLILFPSSLVAANVLNRTSVVWSGIKGLMLPLWIKTALIVILIDLWMYVWHRMAHRLHFLWQFHAVHHSDPDLDVTTAWRFHFVEILFGEILRLGVLVLIGASIEELWLYMMLMTPVIAFHHSNIRIPESLDRALRLIIPTPHMHRVHHSAIRSEHDSNYGSMLSIWDRIFRSFQLSHNVMSLVTGLDGETSHMQQRFFRLLQRPFRKNAYPNF